MPCKRVDAPVVYPAVDPHKPDVPPGQALPIAITFKTEAVLSIPTNIADLSPEEQNRIVSKIRFQGIRLRPDLAKFETVPLIRSTMDLP